MAIFRFPGFLYNTNTQILLVCLSVCSSFSQKLQTRSIPKFFGQIKCQNDSSGNSENKQVNFDFLPGISIYHDPPLQFKKFEKFSNVALILSNSCQILGKFFVNFFVRLFHPANFESHNIVFIHRGC